MSAHGARRGRRRRSAPSSRLAQWWPLVALTVLAAVLRFSTLDLQSLWYDEAFTPVHVLHASLVATLHAVVHTENTPPLWYVLEWAVSRVLGTGAVALRLLSALAGVATVPVVWAIGRELSGRRAALAARRVHRRQPAVRVVFPGGARVRAVRAVRGARDAVLPARRA